VDGRWLEERLGVSFGISGVADDVQNGRRVGNVECGARSARDLEDGLAYVGDEPVGFGMSPPLSGP
jgi:hypothetical protein